MPALQSQLELITLDQYEALPEDKRAEVFDGVIYDMASPSQIHQTILTELLVIIRNYIKSKMEAALYFLLHLMSSCLINHLQLFSQI